MSLEDGFFAFLSTKNMIAKRDFLDDDSSIHFIPLQ